MQDPFALRYTEGVHQIAEGLTLEWLDEGKIHVVTFYDVKRETMDISNELTISIIQGLIVNNEPYLSVQDISGMILTPYVRSKGAEVFSVLKETNIEGTVIFLLGANSPFSPIAKFFLTATNRLFRQKVQLYFETDREKALARLRAVLKSHPNQS